MSSLQNLKEEYTNLFDSPEAVLLSSTYDKLIDASEVLVQKGDKLSRRSEDLSNTSVMMNSLGKNYSDLSRLAFILEESFVGASASALNLTIQGAKELLGGPSELSNIDREGILQTLDDAGIYLSDFSSF